MGIGTENLDYYEAIIQNCNFSNLPTFQKCSPLPTPDAFTFQIGLYKICLWNYLIILIIEQILPAREGLFDRERAQNTCEPAALEAESEVAGSSRFA